MTAMLHILVCGPGAERAASAIEGGALRAEAGPSLRVCELDAATLNRAAEQFVAPAIAFADAAHLPAASALNAAAKMLAEADGPEAVLAGIAEDSLLAECWTKFAAPVAVRTRPPDCGVVALRTAAWRTHGGFRNVSRPLWDWCVRAADAGATFELIAGGRSGTKDVDEPLPALAPAPPGRERAWLLEHLQQAAADKLVHVASPDDAIALQAGLLQMHDFLEESHNLSQSIEGRGRRRSGDYWHGIMHRREPDDSNAKYWFRRVGRHPIFIPLADRAADMLAACDSRDAETWRRRLTGADRWDPLAFVDFCAACRRGSDAALESAARRIQWIEMVLLLESTARDAAGG